LEEENIVLDRRAGKEIRQKMAGRYKSDKV